ncbi:uncharacterized protein LOC114799595 [Denticeps clupeoides]|uniref:uncharacterized protein LOC114799595 n=1 Tax=Denticeps clupeoides TaxID=299321 RepID=UPI0010A593C0|nr:uncharacterized protein LOC114799595 [Denticeps clupeoides]
MQEKSTHKKSAGGRAGMDTYEQQSLRRVRKISQTIARDLCHKIPQINGNNVETQSLIGRGERSRRPTCRLPLVDSLITDRANLLLQDASPAMQSRKTILPGKVGDLYLPRITGKLVRGPLSQSCPYLYSRRRGSVSSILSHRSSDCSTQGPARTQKISSSSRSNVMVTMTYLGQKFSGTSLDEMKVLQQICGGENICVFKGPVRPGEQFQFISQRHLAYPFSATFYVNGIIAGRISSCCEYRYTPGLQQGQKSCFRLSRLTGGKPCYRCVNARLSIVQPVQKPKEAPIDPHLYPDVLESRTSSPLFVPVGMERDARRTKTHPTDRISMSTDSEDIAHNTKERGPAKRQKDHQSQKKDSKRSVASQTHKEPNPPGGGPSMSKPQGLQQGSRSGGKVNPPEGRKSPEAGECCSTSTACGYPLYVVPRR